MRLSESLKRLFFLYLLKPDALTGAATPNNKPGELTQDHQEDKVFSTSYSDFYQNTLLQGEYFKEAATFQTENIYKLLSAKIRVDDQIKLSDEKEHDLRETLADVLNEISSDAEFSADFLYDLLQDENFKILISKKSAQGGNSAIAFYSPSTHTLNLSPQLDSPHTSLIRAIRHELRHVQKAIIHARKLALSPEQYVQKFAHSPAKPYCPFSPEEQQKYLRLIRLGDKRITQELPIMLSKKGAGILTPEEKKILSALNTYIPKRYETPLSKAEVKQIKKELGPEDFAEFCAGKSKIHYPVGDGSYIALDKIEISRSEDSIASGTYMEDDTIPAKGAALIQDTLFRMGRLEKSYAEKYSHPGYLQSEGPTASKVGLILEADAMIYELSPAVRNVFYPELIAYSLKDNSNTARCEKQVSDEEMANFYAKIPRFKS